MPPGSSTFGNVIGSMPAIIFSAIAPLDPSRGLPHAMPPEDLLRLIAIQQLASWDRRRHRGVIRQVAEMAETESVRRLARVLGR